eukprot:2150444-Karenia_brevis.AAC.1
MSVDILFEPTSKDQPGWYGPVKVASINAHLDLFNATHMQPQHHITISRPAAEQLRTLEKTVGSTWT